MKIPLLLAASLVATCGANAQTLSAGDQASSTLHIFGSAPSACVLSPPIAASGANASFTAQGGQTGVIRFTQFVDPQTAQPRGGSISLAFPVVCNSAHRVTVRTDGRGLARTAGAGPAAGVGLPRSPRLPGLGRLGGPERVRLKRRSDPDRPAHRQRRGRPGEPARRRRRRRRPDGGRRLRQHADGRARSLQLNHEE
jgi:hypothetical protein